MAKDFNHSLNSAVVLVAHELEVAPLRRLVGADALEVYVLGVGVVQSIKNSAQLSQKLQGRDILFLGSCGSFNGAKLPVFSLISASCVSFKDLACRNGLAYGVHGIEPLLAFEESAQVFERYSVVCSPSISLEAGNVECGDVENIELYGVYATLREKVRSFATGLVVTNAVCAMAHEEWKTNHEEAYSRLAHSILNEYL